MFERIKRLFIDPTKEDKDEKGSIAITDESLTNSFTDNPDFPYLVSFPRTGSHWLRMLMELYFEKPSLVRAFYFKEAKDFTCYHWHDEELRLERRNVLYLYRHPVPTIYSQLNYHQESLEDTGRIRHWAELYGRHLRKWLITDVFTTKKTVLTYEGMKANLATEFEKVCRHFGRALDESKLLEASARVTKENLKEKTRHDNQVVNLSNAYGQQREAFQQKHAPLVMKAVLAQHASLRRLFE